jgi:nucleoid-associated protein YgaU
LTADGGEERRRIGGHAGLHRACHEEAPRLDAGGAIAVGEGHSRERARHLELAVEANAARAIRNYVASKGLPTEKLDIDFDANSSTVTVSGSVPDQATREKVVVCCGNVASVAHVNDRLQVANAGKPGDYYTVKSGDSLSKIAQHLYGDANRYSAIFEANKPMLSDPDKIYPGQTLRIPRLS